MPVKTGVTKLLTEEFLRSEFIDKKRTQRSIANELDCSESVVSVALKNLGLRRPKSHRFVGKKYGMLQTIEVVGADEHGHSLVLCECDCGKTSVELLYQLTTECKGTCGCSSRMIGKDHPLFRGHEELPGRLFRCWQKGAELRGFSFEVTIEYVWQLFVQQERRCALTGLPLCFSRKTAQQKLTTASLDRIDSGLGYIEGNLRWVHKVVNIMRRNMTDDVFLYWCRSVVNFLGVN